MTINAAKLGLSVLKCCHCGLVKPAAQMPAFCHHCMGPVCTSKPCHQCGFKKSQMEALKQKSETKHHYDQFAAH